MTPFLILQPLPILRTEKKHPQEQSLIPGIIAPGQASEEITINADTGTYDYYCTLHPFMKGQLTIEGNVMQ